MNYVISDYVISIVDCTVTFTMLHITEYAPTTILRMYITEQLSASSQSAGLNCNARWFYLFSGFPAHPSFQRYLGCVLTGFSRFFHAFLFSNRLPSLPNSIFCLLPCSPNSPLFLSPSTVKNTLRERGAWQAGQLEKPGIRQQFPGLQ